MKKRLMQELRNLGVLVVYLFGSRAAGTGLPSSDIDLGVILGTPPWNIDTRVLYHNLYELFSDLYPGSRVDIVFLQTSPIALQFSAIREGKILFEGNPGLRADYESLVIQQYLDFRPVLDFFDRAAEERYAGP
jgi:predicted nucleotidyltransferase